MARKPNYRLRAPRARAHQGRHQKAARAEAKAAKKVKPGEGGDGDEATAETELRLVRRGPTRPRR